MKRKTLRRICHLMSLCEPWPKFLTIPLTIYEHNEKHIELQKLLVENNFTEVEAYELWYDVRSNHYDLKCVYWRQPIKIRKDNSPLCGLNYGGPGNNRSKIRFPKKKRKTAWKRFYKLFPHLKPNEES